jgi:outer membrane protein assembly factor BamB
MSEKERAMLSSSAEPSPLVRIISGFFLGLSLIGYALFGWSLYLVHTPPLAPAACAQTQARPSPASIQDELFVAVTSSIGQQAYHAVDVFDSNSAICVVRVSDGAIVQRYILARNMSVQVMTQVGGVLYYLAEDVNAHNQLCAMRASSGARLWCANPPVGYVSPLIQSPLVVTPNGMVYVMLVTGGFSGLSAYQASDGRQLWSIAQIGPTFAVTGNSVYVFSTPEQQVCALQASDGTRRWCRRVSAQNALAGIGADTKTVYVLDSSGVLTALHPADGTSSWTSDLPLMFSGSPWLPNMLVADGMIYVAGRDTRGSSQYLLSVVQASTGAALWNAPETFPLMMTAAGGVLYLESVDNLQALQGNSGTSLWQDTTAQPYAARLVAAGGSLYVLDSGSTLSTYDRKNGHLLWQQRQCPNGNSAPQRGADGAIT